MSKLNILTGRIARPQKAVLFGPEGIGKSTLAAQFPAPVFLDTEGGTHHLDVARLPSPKSWADVVAGIAALGERLGISTHQVRYLRRRKKISYVRAGGRMVRFWWPQVVADLRRFEIKAVGRTD